MWQNKSSQKVSIPLVILVSTVMFSTCTKGAVTFSDGNFQASDWEVVVQEWGNGGSVTSETRQAGGNPGAFMRILTSVNAAPPQSCIAGVFLCASAIYNPAERGAIQTFDYSESSIMIYGFGQGQATSLAIRQNGRIYYAGLGHANRGLGHANILKWTQNSFTGLTSDDFGRPYEPTGHHPDFSENAPPLQFGFYRLNSAPSFSYSRDAGIDNWSVTIHNKPPDAGSLQVIIEPQEAVDAGALWRRVGTAAWLDSGYIETGLSPGQYTVEFSDVPGYVTPDEQTETLELQDQLHLVGSYFYVGSITFSDGNFQESDWEVISEEWGNGGSVTSETRQAGGNPEAFMRILTSVNAAHPQSCIAGVFLCANAIYNPAERGAIQTFDYSESSIMLSGWDQGQATSLAIRQNGRIYYAGLGHANRGLGHANILKWTQNSFTGLTSDDFGRPYEPTGHHPDFSENAPPLQFGFYRLNSAPSFSYSIDAGIDNWSVTIHNKPFEGGSLHVIIEPQEAVDAGAKWRRVGTSAWLDSDLIETNIPAGDWVVEFKDINGWVKPANTPVTILTGEIKDITATYNTDSTQHTLNVSSNTGGSVIDPGEGSFMYSPGKRVKLEAIADPGYRFINWSGSTSSANNPTTVIMYTDLNIQAQFAAVDVPALILPFDGAMVSTTPVFQVLSWAAEGELLQYKIEILQNGLVVKRFDQTQDSTNWDKTDYISNEIATFDIPEDQALTPGVYQWCAYAFDGQNWSQASQTRTFNVAKEPFIDLIVESISIITPSPDTTKNVKFGINVRNLGNQDLNQPFTISLSLNGPLPEGQYIDKITINSISANELKEKEAEWVWVKPGTQTIYAYVDLETEIIESDEKNNSAEATFYVDGIKDDLNDFHTPTSELALIVKPFKFQWYIEYSEQLVLDLFYEGYVPVVYENNVRGVNDANIPNLIRELEASQYGVIHFTTHGTNKGVLIETFETNNDMIDRWNFLLKNYYGNDGTKMAQELFQDIDEVDKKPAIGITGDFIRHHLTYQNSNPIVYFESCLMGSNEDMRKAFIYKGAGCYIGFDQEVLICLKLRVFCMLQGRREAEEVSQEFYDSIFNNKNARMAVELRAPADRLNENEEVVRDSRLIYFGNDFLYFKLP